jgi:TupA-like ATPgrasp
MPTAQRGTVGAYARISLTYLWRHGRLPAFNSPLRFTELVQLSKLHDRNRLMPLFADKVAAKQLVAAELGAEWIIPTLWHGRRLPRAPQWPLPLVVKSRHGCNQRVFVRSGDADWDAIGNVADKWVRTTYGSWLDEWLYSQIEPGVLVEPFVGLDGQLPVDYKFYVFGGQLAYIQVHLDRERHHRWIVLDRDWRRASSQTADSAPPKPHSFTGMIAAAEVLGRSFDFVRVDFYDIAGTPLFGEMTFYPGSGLDRFDPVGLDLTMGALWHAARRKQGLPQR